MKKFILVTFSVFMILDCFGQNYIPFDFDNGIWRCYKYRKAKSDGDSYELQYYSKGDTLINDTIYNKLYVYGYNLKPIYLVGYEYFNNYVGGILNQVSEKTVRLIKSNNTTSTIIYNFNLKIDDTINLGYKVLNVKSIDSVKYCSKYHKRYILNDYLNNGDTISLIEGIGLNTGLVDNFPYNGENDSWLECYFEKNSSNCNSCDLLTTKQELVNTDDIFLNYTNNEIYLKSKSPIYCISIYDINGRFLKVLNVNNITEYTFNIKDISKLQILLVEIKCQNGMLTKKIIK